MIQFLIEVIFSVIIEVTIRLPGYSLMRCFRRAADVDLESNVVFLTGLMAWAGIVGVVALVVWAG